MPTDTTEKGYEEPLESELLGHGYEKGSPGDFDEKLALEIPRHCFASFGRRSRKHGTSSRGLKGLCGTEVEAKVVANIARELDQRGMLDCDAWGQTLAVDFFPTRTTGCQVTAGCCTAFALGLLQPVA